MRDNRQIINNRATDIDKYYAVIYARYSSEKQQETSIDGQISVCKDYAAKNNIEIVDIFVDRAMTGTNDNRPEFQRMLKESETNRAYTIVLVYRLDRFGRNQIEAAINKGRLLKSGKVLISANEKTSYNFDGSRDMNGVLMESLYMGMAEHFSLELGQKVKRGNRECRLKGQYTGGYVPYGYYVENKKYVIDEQKAEIVREMFRDYARGLTMKEILDGLGSRGISLNKSQGAAYNLFKDRRYIGIAAFAGEEYDNIVPPIISKDLFERVQRRFEQNRYRGNRYTATVPYLLSGKVFCGDCGEPMVADLARNSQGKEFRYYKCRGRKHHSGCLKDTVWKEYLEDFVFRITMKKLRGSTGIKSVAARVYDIFLKNDNTKDSLRKLSAKRNKKQTELDNVTNAIADGIYNDTIKLRVQTLQNELDEIDTEIAVIENKSAARISKERIEEYVRKILAGKKEMVLRHLVRKVVIFKEKVVIYYNVSEDGEFDTKPLHSRDKGRKCANKCPLNENEDQQFVSPRISVAGAVRIELTSKGSESFVLPLHYAPIWL